MLPSRDIFSQLLRTLYDHPNAAAISPLILNQDLSIQHYPYYYYYSTFTNFFHCLLGYAQLLFRIKPFSPSIKANHIYNVAHVCGCFILIKKNFIPSDCLFDPDYPFSYEDMDLCFRLRSNLKDILYTTHLSVVHLGGLSRGRKPQSKLEYSYLLGSLLFLKKSRQFLYPLQFLFLALFKFSKLFILSALLILLMPSKFYLPYFYSSLISRWLVAFYHAKAIILFSLSQPLDFFGHE